MEVSPSAIVKSIHANLTTEDFSIAMELLQAIIERTKIKNPRGWKQNWECTWGVHEYDLFTNDKRKTKIMLILKKYDLVDSYWCNDRSCPCDSETLHRLRSGYQLIMDAYMQTIPAATDIAKAKGKDQE